MGSGPCTFKKRDIDAAIKAGFQNEAAIVRVEIVSKAGKMLIQACKTEPTANIDKNDWEEV